MKKYFILLFIVICTYTNVYAEGFNLTDYSARGTGLAGAMVARADDASALAYNPAGITQLTSTQVMLGASSVSPFSEINTYTNGVSSDYRINERTWINPHFYFATQLSERVYVGLATFSRFGLGNSYDDNWAGQYNLKEVQLTTYSLNPNIAFKLTDKLSLAVGLELMYASMKLERAFASPISQTAKLNGDTFTPGFNLALHYKLNESWALGLTYRSAITHKVEGEGNFSPSSSPISFTNSGLSGKLYLPDQIGFGLLYKPTEKLSIELGGLYTFWSKYKEINIDLENQIQVAGINLNQMYTKKNWKDSWTFNVGVEYDLYDWLSLRAGYAYETSPVNMSTADYMTPSNGRQRFSVGAGFKHENWTFDIAYSYLDIENLDFGQSYNAGTSGVLAGTSSDAYANVFVVTVGYKF